MGRFNSREAKPAKKVRVCLFVDPDVYRRLKALCTLDSTNVSLWFDRMAKDHLEKHTLGFEPESTPLDRVCRRKVRT